MKSGERQQNSAIDSTWCDIARCWIKQGFTCHDAASQNKTNPAPLHKQLVSRVISQNIAKQCATQCWGSHVQDQIGKHSDTQCWGSHVQSQIGVISSYNKANLNPASLHKQLVSRGIMYLSCRYDALLCRKQQGNCGRKKTPPKRGLIKLSGYRVKNLTSGGGTS